MVKLNSSKNYGAILCYHFISDISNQFRFRRDYKMKLFSKMFPIYCMQAVELINRTHCYHYSITFLTFRQNLRTIFLAYTIIDFHKWIILYNELVHITHSLLCDKKYIFFIWIESFLLNKLEISLICLQRYNWLNISINNTNGTKKIFFLAL